VEPVKISVVVPAFNEERGLAGSLASIRAALTAFDRRGWASELIVCDNNSTDGTAALAKAAGAIVVFEPVNQIARARNTGAARATGDWLVFVDADSHPGVELFADVAEEIQRGRCLAGGSFVALDGDRRLPRVAVAGWNLISRLTRWAAGSFIFCETAAFREAGGFSLEFFAGEEIDLFRRLKRAARRKGRTVVILTAHPLVTSDRKARLYSWHELLFFTLRAVAGGGRALKDPAACYAWYDGRR
jgi:glycosyltransferase involved in cell wall biosynthesis